MAELGIKVITSVVLLICTVQDIRNKKIFLWIILAGMILIAVCLPFSQEFSIIGSIAGTAVGTVIIITSLATSGQIGMGDALLLCMTGLALGFWNNLELFAIALFMAAVISIILLIFRLADRKKSIPFVPFLLVSYLLMLFIHR